MRGADDPTVLAWAARENRVLLTHDVPTMSRFAYDRIEAGAAMSAVLEIPATLALGAAIDDLPLVASASLDGEWGGQVVYLPLR